MKSSEKTGAPQIEDEAPRKKSRLRENIEALVIAILLALFIRAFVIQPFKIPSGSMIPTLLVGDQIFVTKFAYGIRMPFTNRVLIPTGMPRQGDVVVFKYPENPSQDFIKRVVAVEGDTVEMKDRVLFVNGKPYDDSEFTMYTDPYRIAVTQPGKVNFAPIAVPAGGFFVMGDNRDNSHDSRYWSNTHFVDYSLLRGKAVCIYFSFDKDLMKVRWGRIGDILR